MRTNDGFLRDAEFIRRGEVKNLVRDDNKVVNESPAAKISPRRLDYLNLREIGS
jgi:hypothetical protein